MSSLTNCDNQSASAPMSESDNDDENEFDSSCNRQNESMMHKVKDVVSKLLHPSFLFSTNDDTDRPKRKRSISIEEQQQQKQQPTTTTTDTTNGHRSTSRLKYDRSTIQDDEPQITDDEDNNSRDALSTKQDATEIEQQKKRRRTANYQHILSTTKRTNDDNDDDERTFSPLTSTDNVRSLSNRRIDQPNRFTPAKQRFDVLPTYRGSTSNYDPTKSPLFSAGNRKTTETTTNLKSNEFSANYLLASGLVSRPQTSSTHNQQSPATLTNPNNTNRQMFGINYSSINSRRLPYIERLRRRTLQDCIRLNRTLDSEPLSESVIEEHKSTTASPLSKRIKAQEKECGIQCDISTESNKKIQSTFPPADIRSETLTIPPIERSQSSSQTDSPIETNSSITIERIQPKLNITKPKVLGNVTPFSWPAFARAQDEYAKKYPEKCSTNNVVSSNIGSSNTNTTSGVLQQTNTSSTMPKASMFSIPAARSTGNIWKCPSCTKEHPAQTAICSLCRQINSNYKKPSAIEQPTITTGKESVLTNKLPDVITKESSVPTSIINQTVPTTTATTKESVLSIPPVITTSITFPTFGVTPSTSLSVTTKESSISFIPPVTTTAPAFGITPIAISKENPITTTTSSSSITSSFDIIPITTTKENPIITTTTTNSITPPFGVMPIVSPIATTKESSIITTKSITPPFGVTTTKENPVVTTSTPPMFGTSTLFDKTLTSSSSISPFSSGTTFQPFIPISSISPITAVTSSAAPSIATITPSMPTTISFGLSSSNPVTPLPPPTTTTAAPVVSTVSSGQFPAFTFAHSASAPSLSTNNSTNSNLFGFQTVVPTPAATTITSSSASSFPTPSTTNTFTNPSGFTLTPATTTTTAIPFGSGGGFSLTPTSTTNNRPFAFGASSSSSSLIPPTVTSNNSTTTPSFGTVSPFGASTSFGTTPSFGISSAPIDRSTTSVPSSSSFGILNTPPTFGFGSSPSTIAASTSVAPTGGFPFTPSTSIAPVFGAGPPPLSSGGSTSPFIFSGSSGAPPAANNNLFQFTGTIQTSTTNNLFAMNSSDSTAPPNPFDVTTSETPAPRRILKPKRRNP